MRSERKRLREWLLGARMNKVIVCAVNVGLGLTVGRSAL